MTTLFRRAAIRVLMWSSWRISARRVADSMHRFSTVEADSAWQFLQALGAADDPVYRAEIFNNARRKYSMHLSSRNSRIGMRTSCP